jgi:hypothetical protein
MKTAPESLLNIKQILFPLDLLLDIPAGRGIQSRRRIGIAQALDSEF